MTKTKRIASAALLCGLIAAPVFHLLPAQAQPITPDVTSLAAVVFPGSTSTTPEAFGVYVGHGLVLTNWHPWTLDGQFYTGDNPAISPSHQAPRYDDDQQDDPGEDILNMADCSGTWEPLDQAGATCTPFARIQGAGFIFPLADDTGDPVPAERLLYASRTYDIALFQVDAAAVEVRGVRPARLSLIPTGADYPVAAAYQLPDQPAAAVDAVLRTGVPALLPEDDTVRLTGPWRVPSLVMDTPDPLSNGGPVFDRQTGDLVGLTWRAGENPSQPQTWVTPAAVWIHDLYAANDTVQSEALAAVLSETSAAPIAAPTTLNDPLIPGLGNAGIDVQHYTLKLDLDPANQSLAGIATLDIRATVDHLSTFSLDAAQFTIDQVQINGADAPFAAKEQKLLIQLPDAVPYGTLFQVSIVYHTTPQTVSSPYVPFISLGMTMETDHVFTLNEPDAAHTWFPCNDHPSDRATYDFYLRVPLPLDAIANGHLVETFSDTDDTQTFHWQMTYPMASYLALVAVADYVMEQEFTPDGILIQTVVYAGQEKAGRKIFSHTADTLELFELLFGPYPYDSYGHVVVHEDTMAMESQTMTLMPDILLDTNEIAVYPIMSHELAHHWFGDTVTIGAWSDIWLNEGFATYAQWLSQENRFGENSAIATRTYSEQALLTDSRATPLIAPAPADMFGLASYDKGAWLLHMLRGQIGDEAFFTLLQTYVQTFKDRPASSVDFWRLAEEISGQDLTWFFDQWLLQGGIPRYMLYWSNTSVLLCADPSGGEYRLSLPLHFSATEETYSDVVLDVTGAETRMTFPLSYFPSDLVVDPDQAVLAQVQVQPIAELPEVCPKTP